MDLEPIYCAEQISVPPDLADILKAYTKEVVRRQPEDMYEFSAIYFANLAGPSHRFYSHHTHICESLQLVCLIVHRQLLNKRIFTSG